MYCKFCGAPLPLGATECRECKRGQSEPYAAEDGGQPKLLGRRRFWWRNYRGKWSVWLSALMLFAAAAWVFYIGMNDTMVKLWSLIDAGVLAGCGFMVLFFRARIFALAALGYSLVTVFFAVKNNALLSGWEVPARLAFVLAAAVLGVYGTIRFRRRYKRYKREYRLRYPAGKGKNGE